MIFDKISIINNEVFDKIIIIFFVGLLTILLYSILSKVLMHKPYNVVVFDLDETLGSFSQLAVLKEVIEKYENRYLSQDEFNNLIDLNPNFIRPGIIRILNYIVKKRREGKCYKIMIYTNNQGPKEWTELISNYFSYKIGENVFDQIIAAFKINGKRIEPCRTSHDKSYNDFINCTKLPSNTQVFFVDDVKHEKMEDENVYYINIKPYHYKPSIEILLNNKYSNNFEKIENLMMKAKTMYHPRVLEGINKIEEEQEIDIVLGKFMYEHICTFFKNKNSNNKTRKNRKKT